MRALSPDVYKPFPISVLRKIIRWGRMSKQKIFNGAKLKVGRNVTFGPNTNLMIPDELVIKNNFSCGANFLVQTNLYVGNDCLVSSDVSFVGHDHTLDNPSMTAYWSGRKVPSKVVLEGNNFIGYRSTIVGSVTIGEGAIVAAGAVVVRDVAPYSVVAGVPARHVKNRF